jgi:cyclophilin family peptidyl-prolyl cis-trans isomerase
MNRLTPRSFLLLVVTGIIFAWLLGFPGNVFSSEKKSSKTIKVRVTTNMGEFVLELYPDRAPITVKNFLRYVDRRFYDGTIFHRVIPGFVIQGGGYTKDLVEKPTDPPIKNEANNGLRNERGTIAMARTSIIDSATSQFFINLKDNDFLNHRDQTPSGFGYAVFGRVIQGMDVVERIAQVPTGIVGGMRDVPLTPVIILKIRRIR